MLAKQLSPWQAALALACLAAAALAAQGGEPPTVRAPGVPDASVSWDATQVPNIPSSIRVGETPESVQPLLMQLIWDFLPHSYANSKKWGKQREVWDGLHIRREGLQIKTKRRKKEVNHGTWTRYQLTLIDPQKNVLVKTTNIHRTDDGRAAFDLALAAKLDVYGRVQEWNRGIRLISLSMEGVADVELQMKCTMRMQVDATKLVPDVVLDPEVTEAKLLLLDLQLKRLSKAEGPLVRELSHSVENIVQEELAQRDHKLVAKINRQIDKHRDELRLSLVDLVKARVLGDAE